MLFSSAIVTALLAITALTSARSMNHGRYGSDSPRWGRKSNSTRTAPSCPGDLPGKVLTPNLAVPVSQQVPDMAFGQRRHLAFFTPNDFGMVVNFNIPPEAANKTCSLYFSFPSYQQLGRKPLYTFGGSGNFSIQELSSAPKKNVTYATLPAVSNDLGISNFQPGNLYLLSTGPCASGTTSTLTTTTDTTFIYSPGDDKKCPLGLFTTYQ